MVARLTIVLFILVSLEAGILLTLLPWVSDWNNNYLLIAFVDSTGLGFVETVVTSNWFRGAVTGLGIFNLFVAFWEIAHFGTGVQALENPAADPDHADSSTG